jgi:hypothetical protein
MVIHDTGNRLCIVTRSYSRAESSRGAMIYGFGITSWCNDWEAGTLVKTLRLKRFSARRIN